MLRQAFARVLHALADRIEPEGPEVQIQYVYVYSVSPAITVQPNPTLPTPTLPYQSPFWYSSGSTICAN